MRYFIILPLAILLALSAGRFDRDCMAGIVEDVYFTTFTYVDSVGM